MAKKNTFLFEVGELVTLKDSKTPIKITKRKAEKNHLLSKVHEKTITTNVYFTEEEFKVGKRTTVRRYIDEELHLTSANTKMPEGTVDYASDEMSADFLDKDGNILLTVKSGSKGKAHEIVSKQIYTFHSHSTL